MSYQVYEKAGKGVLTDEYKKTNIPSLTSFTNVYGVAIKDYSSKFYNQNKRLTPSSIYNERNIGVDDPDYGLFGTFSKTTDRDVVGGFHSVRGYGEMQKDGFFFEPAKIENNMNNFFDLKNQHGYDFDRYKHYIDDTTLKTTPVNKSNVSISCNEISKQNLKSHINGRKSIDKGVHHVPHGFYDYVPSTGNKDTLPNNPSMEDYKRECDIYYAGYNQKVGAGKDYVDIVLRRGQTGDLPPDISKNPIGFNEAGRDSGYKGYSNGLR